MKQSRRQNTTPTQYPWKEKNLDYEIETQESAQSALQTKQAWKEKNLDYEIETSLKLQAILDQAFDLKRKEPRLRDWNLIFVALEAALLFLKRKEPRLRDWNKWE